MKKGFTLAEILITLAIIGLVAAMTIPSLVEKSNDAEYRTALKNFNATLSQATAKIQIENGGDIWDDSGAKDYGWYSQPNSIRMRAEYKKHLKLVKEGAVKDLFYPLLKQYKVSTGFNMTTYVAPAAVLSDGSYVVFYSFQNCASTNCGVVGVDVNGMKGPNMMGKDYYEFYIGEQSQGNYIVIPSGSRGFGPTACVAGNGQGCASKVLLDQDF